MFGAARSATNVSEDFREGFTLGSKITLRKGWVFLNIEDFGLWICQLSIWLCQASVFRPSDW